MATIFDNQDEWTTLYKKLVYLLCKNGGNLHVDFEKQMSKLKSNNSFDKINLISDLIKQQFSNDELFSHLRYLIKVISHLKVWKEEPIVVPTETEKEIAENNFDDVFENKSEIRLFFDRKEAANSVKDSFDTLLVVCDILIKAGAGDIPLADITPDKITTNNEKLKKDAITVLNMLGRFNSNHLTDEERKYFSPESTQSVINKKRQQDENKKKDKTPKEDWSVRKGLKTRISPEEVTTTDDDTPNRIMNYLWGIYKEYSIDDISGHYGEWISKVVSRHKIYSSSKDLLRLNYNIHVTNDLKNGQFDFDMTFGTMKPDLIENAVKKYGSMNRLDTICFVPPVPTFYDLFSLFKVLKVGFTADKKIHVVGSIIANKANDKADPIVKKMVDYLLTIKNHKEFGIEYMDNVEANSDIWYDYLERRLATNTAKVKTAADVADDTAANVDSTGSNAINKINIGANLGDMLQAAEKQDEQTATAEPKVKIRTSRAARRRI